ncbi:hypothetical protein KM043_002039 [Ampulex compressa]|nr:hypothetical protein KM043_002039 [Ampulex compressa]
MDFDDRPTIRGFETLEAQGPFEKFQQAEARAFGRRGGISDESAAGSSIEEEGDRDRNEVPAIGRGVSRYEAYGASKVDEEAVEGRSGARRRSLERRQLGGEESREGESLRLRSFKRLVIRTAYRGRDRRTSSSIASVGFFFLREGTSAERLSILFRTLFAASLFSHRKSARRLDSSLGEGEDPSRRPERGNQERRKHRRRLREILLGNLRTPVASSAKAARKVVVKRLAAAFRKAVKLGRQRNPAFTRSTNNARDRRGSIFNDDLPFVDRAEYIA